MIDRKNSHLVITAGTFQGIITKRQKYVITPPGEALKNAVLGRMYSLVQRGIIFAVSGIDAVIPCHLKVPIRDVLYQELHKVKDRDRFPDKTIVFMPVVMESDLFPVIGIDSF